MNKKKIGVVLLSLAVLLNLFICIFVKYVDNKSNVIDIEISLKCDKQITFQTFYGSDMNFIEEQSVKNEYHDINKNTKLEFPIPSDTRYVRFDFGDSSSNIVIKQIYFKYKNQKLDIDYSNIINTDTFNMINKIYESKDGIHILTDNVDPYCVINIDKYNLSNLIHTYEQKILNIKKVLVCIGINLFIIFIYYYKDKLLLIPLDIIKNRNLIFYLSKNDFKTKYAGSYLGIFWAFIQPIITILLYWFVFQVGFRSSTIANVPFILWLVAGLIPWFFFSDAISSATNCFIEYSYLVKKVLFKISILPMVKIGSAFFVHVFFVAFTIFLYILYGYAPSVYLIQLLYYIICMLVLILSTTYITSSIICFFKDFGQIINIYLQIAMWATPIMWNYTMIPQKYRLLFIINPMYYIVDGYRDALINKIWFFDKFDYTVYFWIVVSINYILGTIIFKKLKPHFADVI